MMRGKMSTGKSVLAMHWQERTQKKSWHVPDFVALCEVENDSVLFDLTRRSALRGVNYDYVMTDSPDERGIDVALLYQPSSFALIQFRSIRIKPLPDTRPTRDILYASGRIMNDDTLHVFVLHAPSRRGGEQVSRPSSSRYFISSSFILLSSDDSCST